MARCLRRAYQKSDDCHDDERREARRVRVSLFGESNAIEYVTTVTTMSAGRREECVSRCLSSRRGGRKENPHDRSRTIYAAGA